MRRALIIAAVFATGALPAAASGAIYPIEERAGSPVLDGERTLWLERDEERPSSFRVVSGEAGARRVLHTVADADPQLTLEPGSLTAAAGVVAVGIARSFREPSPEPREERSYRGTELLVSRDAGPSARSCAARGGAAW